MLRDYLAGFLMLVVSSSVSAADVKLTGKMLIDGPTVTVGDLFTNAGEHASHALALAPAPGKTLVLSKKDLQRVVDSFGFSWRAPEEDVTVTLERNATTLDAETLIHALENSALKDKISSEASFSILEPAQPVIVAGRALPELSVEQPAFDPATERFAATVKVLRDGKEIQEFTVSGTATPMTRVPVPVSTLAPNAVITASDIVEKYVPRRTVRHGTVLTADELVGLSPKRTLQPGQPVLASELTPPLMVKRNELVTVIYRNGPVMLSTRARALANGARGDTVTLMNISSKKPFDARITGPQQAEIVIDAFNG